MNSTAWADDAGAEAGSHRQPVVYKGVSVCYKWPEREFERKIKNSGVITDPRTRRGRPGEYATIPAEGDKNPGVISGSGPREGCPGDCI